jgi:hypothetical protein
MFSMTTYTVTSVTHDGFRQLPEPCHRKCNGPTVTREIQPVNHTRRNDWDVAATGHCNKLAL